MKKNLLLALFLNWMAILAAQPPYSKSIDLESNANNGFSIKVVDDGYIILVGSANISSPAEYISIVHTNFEGEITWQKHFKNEPWRINVPPVKNSGIIIDENGNMYISGKIEVDGNPFNIFLMKTTPEGDSIWMRTYGGAFEDYNAKILFHTDTTILFLNMKSLSNDVNDFTIWLMETDMEGYVLWEKTFDGGYLFANPKDVLLIENGDFLVSYTTCESSGVCTPDFFQTLAITRFNKYGEELWTSDVSYFEDIYIGGTAVMEALDNGGAVISFYRMNFEEGWQYPPILIWVDSLGSVVNQYDFSSDTERYVRDLQKTSSGEIIGVGFVDMLELGLGGWVYAMSQEGELLWTRDINDLRYPEKWGRFNAVQEAENGGLIVTGFIIDTLENIPASFNQNIWLVKLDSMGCLEPGCGEVQIISGSAEAQVSNKPALFKIYPNPFNDEILVEVDQALSQPFKVRLFNLIGQEVSYQNQSHGGGRTSIKIDQSQPKGVYFLQIGIEGNSQTYKMIKS